MSICELKELAMPARAKQNERYYERTLVRIQQADDFIYTSDSHSSHFTSKKECIIVNETSISYKNVLIPLTKTEVKKLVAIAYDKYNNKAKTHTENILKEL
jgi:hypothetical protein